MGTVNESTIRVRLEVADDGTLKASLQGTSQSLGQVADAQQAQAESATAAAAAQQANAAALTETAESAEAAAARIKAMVANSLAQQSQLAESARSQFERAFGPSTEDIEARLAAGAAASEEAMRRAAGLGNTAGVTSALAAQREELAQLVGQIDPTVAALGKLDAQEAALARFNRQGLLDASEFAALNAAIDQSRQRIVGAGEAMEGFSLNTAQSRREMGYLVKDISTGQWGRLEQSGLTLASNAGLMAKAFSGAGLAITGTIGILGLFVDAAIQGYLQEQKLNDAIIATGNYAGVTTGQLYAMRATIAGFGNGDIGKATTALQLMVSSGKVTGDHLEEAAQAAVDFSNITGASIQSAANEFIKLQGDPVQAVKALDDQLHALTLSEYENIKALQQQGDVETAAGIAQTAIARKLHDRTQDALSNIGLMEKAWDELRDTAKSAWDAMMGIGVHTTASYDIAKDNFTLQSIKSRLPQTANFSDQQLLDAAQNPSNPYHPYFAGDLGQIKQILDQKNTDQLAATMEKWVADTQSANAQADSTLKADSDFWDKVLDGAKSSSAKEKEIRAINEATARDIALNPNNKDEYLQKQKDALALVDKKYTTHTPNLDASLPDPMAALGSSVKGDLKGYKKDLQSWAAETDAVGKFNAALDQSLATFKQRQALQLASATMGQKEYQQYQQLLSIQEEFDAKVIQVTQQLQQKGASQDIIDAQVTKLRSVEAQEIALQKQTYSQLDDIQSNWENGAIVALQNVYDKGTNIAQGMNDAITGAFNDMTTAIVNFADTGKFSLESFAQDFANAILKMELQALEAQAASGLMSWLGGALGGVSGTAGSMSSYGGLNTGSFSGSFDFTAASGGSYARGGAIHGPGTGTSDSVTIRASRGEYMQTADAHEYYGTAFMDAVRAKRLPRFATGGAIGDTYGGGSDGGGAPVINVQNYGSDKVQATSQQMPDGRYLTNIIIGAVNDNIARGGSTAKLLEQRYPLQRRGVRAGSP